MPVLRPGMRVVPRCHLGVAVVGGPGGTQVVVTSESYLLQPCAVSQVPSLRCFTLGVSQAQGSQELELDNSTSIMLSGGHQL